MTMAKHGVTSTTHQKLLIDAGAVYLGFKDADNPGTLLGATMGGNSIEITETLRDVRPDGARGPMKGFRRVDEAVATIKVNMLELTAENLRRAIAGAIYSSGTTPVTDEAVGTGDNTKKIWDLLNSPVKENSEVVKLDGVPKVRLTDYTMDYAAGKIYFFTAPGTDVVITADYTYISGDAVIAGAEITDNAYIDNVTLVGTISGKTTPVIAQINNALCESGLSLSLVDKDEAVPELTFTGHYTYADLVTPPYSITYPAS